MKKYKSLKYKPLKIEDLKIIETWFKGKEVNKWYGRGKKWSLKDLEQKYLPRINGQENVPSFIINVNNENIGFIQYYPLSKTSMPEGLSFSMINELKIDINHSVGVDLFIGNESLIGKGHGSVILKEFIQNVIPEIYTTVYIDPESSNIRAIKSYKKVGFTELPIQPNHKICLLSLDRKNVGSDVLSQTIPMRNSVKILLLDDQNNLLLMCADDPNSTSSEGVYHGKYWFTIGGEIEPGEELKKAALREIKEETGLDPDFITIGPQVWYGEFEMVLSGKLTKLKQHFLVAYTKTNQVTLHNLTQYEKNVIEELRWFSLEDIRQSKDIIYPIVLAEYLPEILQNNFPIEPIWINLGKQPD